MVTSRRLVATGRGLLLVLALLATLARPLHANVDGHLTKRYSDQSVHGYKTEVALSSLSLPPSPVPAIIPTALTCSAPATGTRYAKRSSRISFAASAHSSPTAGKLSYFFPSYLISSSNSVLIAFLALRDVIIMPTAP